ncbi:hypothetical protein GCK72_020836 [Caenorhabditis remanei]|uniref:F-box domain-containing protein n=1 Tax=Caenorhabditis remanei TaxID=31234 RepID=A0A6A5GHW9_CAERE|nr:hypothetical protein GCK72_020836 [Caenorhabditis remanei]KAF1754276.1 hypothetical protein GCK72_020836 [Caenorhabditis remanei]
MSLSFLEIPDVPMEIIMNNLDYIAIQSVRKTCWDLRNFINDKKPGIFMKHIDISEMRDAVKLAISTRTLGLPENIFINLTYEKYEKNGCRISGATSDGYKNKIVENLNFLDAVLLDFKIAINTQKSIFERVTVAENSFYEKFEEHMKSQKPFATESMEIHADSLEHARQIMQHADPKYLKLIHIFSHEPINISETVKLESLKNIQNFSHFSLTTIQLENLDVETIRAIKKNFLQFHEYDKYLFVLNGPNVNENLFIDAFGATFKPPGEIVEIRFFNVPGNEEKVLKVHNTHFYYRFQFIGECEVPEGYVVLD